MNKLVKLAAVTRLHKLASAAAVILRCRLMTKTAEGEGSLLRGYNTPEDALKARRRELTDSDERYYQKRYGWAVKEYANQRRKAEQWARNYLDYAENGAPLDWVSYKYNRAAYDLPDDFRDAMLAQQELEDYQRQRMGLPPAVVPRRLEEGTLFESPGSDIFGNQGRPMQEFPYRPARPSYVFSNPDVLETADALDSSYYKKHVAQPKRLRLNGEAPKSTRKKRMKPKPTLTPPSQAIPKLPMGPKSSDYPKSQFFNGGTTGPQV